MRIVICLNFCIVSYIITYFVLFFLTNNPIFCQVEEISRELVDHLERLSLVEFSNEEGLKRLSSAIKSANQLYMVNTDDVEPLDTVLENRYSC